MMVMSELSSAAVGHESSHTADTGPERQTGRKAQTANIVAAKVSDTTPRPSLPSYPDEMFDSHRDSGKIFR